MIRMIGECHAVHVKGFALEPARRGIDTDNGNNGLAFADLRLDANAVAFLVSDSR